VYAALFTLLWFGLLSSLAYSSLAITLCCAQLRTAAARSTEVPDAKRSVRYQAQVAAAAKGRSRTPPSPSSESASAGCRIRKRSPSLTRSRPSSPSSTCSGGGGGGGGRRAASPSALDPAVLEAVRRRVRRVQQARLYLLQQPGPNSFLVGGDSPEHKYRVVIGPQTCSCGRGPHCLHLLFVMLRVFQIPELDARIYARELKNFEVETLFQKYRERLTLRVNNSMCLPSQDSRSESGPSSIGSNASSGFGSNSPSCANTQDSRLQTGNDTHSTSVLSSNVKNEEDLCPICLLDMVDGESLVTCNTGCRNRLHHHCMAIWALECNHQGEPVLCPLCRQVWEGDTAMAVLPVSPSRPHSSQHLWSNSPPNSSTCSSTHTAHEKTASSYLTDMSFGPPAISPHSSNNNHINHNFRAHSVASSPVKSGRKSISNCSLPSRASFERRGSTGNGMSSSVSQTTHRSMQLSLSSSSVCSCLTEDVTLPHTEAIPPEQLGIAGEWIKVFGVDLICCLYSRDWKAREIAFRRLKSDVSVAYLSDNEEYQQRVLSCCARIMAVFAADPVYKVYEAWVRCLQVMLNHARCRGTSSDADELQRLVRPIVRALLLKCADCNRRTSQLSIDVLLELAKGQEGDLAIGSQTSSSCAMDEGRNLNLVLSCILEDGVGEVSSSNWQSLAGRLVMLERLLHTFQSDFISPNHSHSPILGTGGQRLVSMLEFCANALRSPHVTVNRLARLLFVSLVNISMDVAFPTPIQRACQLINTLEPTLQARLRKMLQQPTVQSPVVEGGKKDATPTTTPQMARKASPLKSDVSPARSSSFQSNTPSLPPKPSRLVPTTSPPRPKDLDLSRTRTRRPVKFQHLPGIGVSSGQSPSPPLLGGVSQKRSGPLHAPSGSRLVNLFRKNSKSEDISVLPTKPACIAGSPVPEVAVAPSLERRLLEDCCPEANLWAKPTKLATPTAPNCTPVKGTLESNPGIVLYHPPSEQNSLDKDQDEEVVVPLVFDDSDYFDNSSGTHCRDLHSAFYPHEKNMEGLNKRESNVIEYNERYREGDDWVRGPILGRGAFSSCYQAWDITSGTLMAVKQVSFCRNSVEEQDRVENTVRQELEVLKTLRHENIVRMIGATKQSTHFSMFVEWMAGGSVSGLLERYGAFSERVILNYTQQVLSGLSYLHHKHILHRDLKGANLLVDSTGKHLRIGDLGTAAQLQAARTLSGEFQGQLLGTIAFMAPEVLRGEDYGRSCDIWSVGCCMIEMATTRPPWRESNASNHLALMYKIACSRDPPRMPDSLQGVARQLALDCLQVHSELRPSAKVLLQSYSFSTTPAPTSNIDSSESNYDSGFYCWETCQEDVDCSSSKFNVEVPTALFSAV
ncbi:Mitogen-activated protein kinase kinase kinase 1, partial [Frankliniella fusca]